jgi:hypothetical protein
MRSSSRTWAALFLAAMIGGADIVDGSIQSIDIKNKNLKQADLQPAEPWHDVEAQGEPQFLNWPTLA